MRRIYTGYVTNLTNNKETYSLIDYCRMELKEICVNGCCSVVSSFPRRLCEEKNFVVSWEFSSKQNYGKKEEIPGKSSLWALVAMSWKRNRLTDNHAQE